MDQSNRAASVLRFVSERQQQKAGYVHIAQADQLKVHVPLGSIEQSARFSMMSAYNSMSHPKYHSPDKRSQVAGYLTGNRDVFDTDVEDLDDTTKLSAPAMSPSVGSRRQQPASTPRHTRVPHKGCILTDYHQAPDSRNFSQENQQLGISHIPGSGLLDTRFQVTPADGATKVAPPKASLYHSRNLPQFPDNALHDNPVKRQEQITGPADRFQRGENIRSSKRHLNFNRHVAKQGSPDRKHSISAVQPALEDPDNHAGAAVNDHGTHQLGQLVTHFGADTDPEDAASEDTRSLSLITYPRDRNRKRARSLDYPLDQLATMSYQKLKDETFDQDPSMHTQELPAKLINRSAQEKLNHLFTWRDNDGEGKQRAAFFASLVMDEYEECGDLIIRKFQTVLDRFKVVRQQKRDACKEFEREIEERHQLITRKREAIEVDLSSMQTKGKDIVPKRNIRLAK